MILKKKKILTSMNKKQAEIFLGAGNNMEMKSSQLVRTYQTLYLMTEDKGTLSLSVEISADFDGTPEEYQEVFLNMMAARYLGRVSFGENPFSQCLPAPKRRWWQFWKPKNLDI
jgi:hypothetical protein